MWSPVLVIDTLRNCFPPALVVSQRPALLLGGDRQFDHNLPHLQVLRTLHVRRREPAEDVQRRERLVLLSPATEMPVGHQGRDRPGFKDFHDFVHLASSLDSRALPNDHAAPKPKPHRSAAP